MQPDWSTNVGMATIFAWVDCSVCPQMLLMLGEERNTGGREEGGEGEGKKKKKKRKCKKKEKR